MPMAAARCRMRTARRFRWARGEHLAVAEAKDARCRRRKRDNGGDHGSGQRAAADFVDTKEQAAPGPGRLLAGQTGGRLTGHLPGAYLPLVSRFSLMRAALPDNRLR